MTTAARPPRRAPRLSAMALLAALAPAGAGAQATGPALAPTAAPYDARATADGTDLLPPPEVAAPAAAPVSLDGDGLSDEGGAATLLADRITLSGDRRLEAAGGVVVWYQGARLVAERVVYEGAGDRVLIDGPIYLSRPDEPSDVSVLVADAAELDADLRGGILRGARMVLARELQLAAREARLSGEGRMTTLSHVAASSCRICAGNPTPLWEIRARRITHDADLDHLTLERPQLRAFGRPVFALPFTITAPGPSVERKTGFLRPRLRMTSDLGAGIKQPYFITLGDSADLTLTPYLAFSSTATLEARYRRAFASGAMEVTGAVSRDDIRDGETRGYVFGAARFELTGGFDFGLQLQDVSDRDYLDDYGISGGERLWSGMTLDRVRGREQVAVRAGAYQTLREGEVQATMPTQVGDALWRRSFALPAPVGGDATLEWSAHAHRRPSDTDVIGRDVARASFTAGWARDAVLAAGLLGRIDARVDADLWRVSQDSTTDDAVARLVPTLAAELRWPLVRSSGSGTEVLEPVAQLVWSPDRGADDAVPIEDSFDIALDEGNLFALDRIPGRDLRETGLRATFGVTWTRLDAAGRSFGLAAGRVFRDEADAAFDGTVLGGLRSDWLLAANFQGTQGLAAAGRVLVGDDRALTRAEARLGWIRPDLQLSAGYVRIAETDGIEAVEEAALDGGWQVRDGLWASAAARYDIDADRPRSAALGIAWKNECVTLEAAIGRSFGAPGEGADTDLDFSLRLGGFGADSGDRVPGTVARRRCLR